MQRPVDSFSRDDPDQYLGVAETPFTGSTACGIDREPEHLIRRENRGEELRLFRFGWDALAITSSCEIPHPLRHYLT